MAKLTVTFKDILLQAVELNAATLSIGRDPTNALHIDSLAIADFHAEVQATPEGYRIRRLHAGFPVYLNGTAVEEALLKDGDRIVLGKHQLRFTDSASQPAAPDGPLDGAMPRFKPFEGSFQVMNGKHIGMIIPLKKAVTQIGKKESGCVIVTKGEQGYTIAAASEDLLLTINGRLVEGEQAPLRDGDIVRINSTLLQFFQR
ncbi:FHA domain-containing protein [Candidatus Methylocalor cossyra]|uniref:FHA domain-containing protein n=1 Tax=Candidatus Methylocalor cossyra TaxID=3108543 RepID=A0ABM9NGF8_9GAMM